LTPTPNLPVAGETRVNPVDGAVYVYIPAGKFTMGSNEPREQPAHLVVLDGYWIMKTEVSNAQYGHCMAAGACTPPTQGEWADPAKADYPVTNIDWDQASAYAAWVNGRLPTEAEWEKAARGTDARPYPWGDQLPDEQLLNYDFIKRTTMPVGSYPAGASPYGVLDMAGNVEEWVADWYADNYDGQAPRQNPSGPASGVMRVLRGGSFNSNRAGVRTSARDRQLPNTDFASLGFRVVRSEL
jgi:eukaryotic-like serine/threonine-protein kinase